MLAASLPLPGEVWGWRDEMNPTTFATFPYQAMSKVSRGRNVFWASFATSAKYAQLASPSSKDASQGAGGASWTYTPQGEVALVRWGTRRGSAGECGVGKAW